MCYNHSTFLQLLKTAYTQVIVYDNHEITLEAPSFMIIQSTMPTSTSITIWATQKETKKYLQNHSLYSLPSVTTINNNPTIISLLKISAAVLHQHSWPEEVAATHLVGWCIVIDP